MALCYNKSFGSEPRLLEKLMTMQKPVDPVPAATMLLLRDAPEFQVLMVKRHHQIDFASGALVFPGGKPSVGDELQLIGTLSKRVAFWRDPVAAQKAIFKYSNA